MKVVGKRLMVSIDENKTTESGIILQSNEEKSKCGVVVNRGDLCEELMSASKVYFDKFSGTKVVLSGEEYLILKEEEVVAYE